MAVKVGMVSLGCAKNQVDAELMLGCLKKNGYQLVAEAGMANVAVVNTCGFIESAKQEAIEEILELAKLKQEGKIKAIIVTGCLAERYQQEVASELPEVDAVVGIGADGQISSIVERVLSGERVTEFPSKELLPLCGERVQTTPYYYSYLKIAEGCSNRCSYCAIPMIRGRFRSRPLEELEDEARRLARNGVRELNVIAQDTTRYGEDLYGKSMLPELLRRLAQIEELEWIRVLYCYPERITDELLDVMAQEQKVVKYIDLPLQHCNEEILRRMNRRGSREELTSLIHKIRKKVPGVTLRTTLIVGFPGESWDQFNELAEFVKELRFERLGCFSYSAEDGTPAAEMENQVEEKTKRRREEIIMEAQMRMMAERAEAMEGQTVSVLVEGYDRYAGSFFGRSPMDAPEVDGKVFFTTEKHSMNAGQIVPVRITGSLDCDLIGELAD